MIRRTHLGLVLCAGLTLTAMPLAVAVAAEESAPSGWSCRNTDAEITCDDGACTVKEEADGFTPMSVSVTRTALSVCAYTGCWEGPAMVLEDDTLLYGQSHALRWSHSEDGEPVTFQLALTKTTGVAVLNGQGYAHPMHCQAR